MDTVFKRNNIMMEVSIGDSLTLTREMGSESMDIKQAKSILEHGNKIPSLMALIFLKTDKALKGWLKMASKDSASTTMQMETSMKENGKTI